MSLSPLTFKIALYEEHLEEIAFLWSQDCALRADPNRAWTDPAPFEERLEAHLDALVVGGALALQVCQERIAEAEPDEMFGIAALLCRAGASAPLNELLHGPVLGVDEAMLGAVTLALVAEWPAAWQEAGVRGLGRGDARLSPIFAAVAASRGWATGGQLSTALRRGDALQRAALLSAVGYCDEPQALALVQDLYGDADPSVRAAAVRAGARLHDSLAYTLASNMPDCPELQALAGTRTAAPALLERLRGAETDRAVVLALGLLGDLSCVRALTNLLAVEPVADAAAWSLHLITGASLKEQALVPEPVLEDELSDAELNRWRKTGEGPRRLDGQPFGERIDRLSRDPAVWGQWLVDNGARFRAGQRYRMGQPCTPERMLQGLADRQAPVLGRQWLCEELQVRHGLILRIQSGATVLAQQGALRQAAPQARLLTEQTLEGRWYLGNQEFPS